MKDRLAAQMAEARRHLAVDWDEERSRRALERNHRLRRRQRNIRLALGGVSVGAAATFLAVVLLYPEAPAPAPRHVTPIAAPAAAPAPAPPAPAPTDERTLADGSSWSPATKETKVEVRTNSATRVALVLRQGRARMAVAPRPNREFELAVDEVVIRVAGSHFAVERAHGKVGVWVDKGHVQVSWPGGADLLQAGRSAWYPLPEEEEVAPRSSRRHRRRRHKRVRRPAPRPEAAVTEPQADGPGDLLRAMDLARSRGTPVEAVELLQAFLRDHARDPRAPLAAFTLGRVWLTQLGRPRQAAQAFARVRTLAPKGSLAEDALAREVEAWARAGEMERARTRGREYLRLYPTGRRARNVRKHAKFK